MAKARQKKGPQGQWYIVGTEIIAGYKHSARRWQVISIGDDPNPGSIARAPVVYEKFHTTRAAAAKDIARLAQILGVSMSQVLYFDEVGDDMESW